MALTLYDSIDLATIPPDAHAVAGYVDGRWPTFDEVRRRWPRALHLSIATRSSSDADALDVEAGDASEGQVPPWVLRQHTLRRERPVIYASVSRMVFVLRELAAASVPRHGFRIWTAHYTHHEHRCSSRCWASFHDKAGATQWTDRALGRNLDASSVFSEEFFPRVRG